MEYLVTMTAHVPDSTPEGTVEDIRTREARPRARANSPRTDTCVALGVLPCNQANGAPSESVRAA